MRKNPQVIWCWDQWGYVRCSQVIHRDSQQVRQYSERTICFLQNILDISSYKKNKKTLTTSGNWQKYFWIIQFRSIAWSLSWYTFKCFIIIIIIIMLHHLTRMHFSSWHFKIQLPSIILVQPRPSNCSYSQVSLKRRRIPSRSPGAWCASLAGVFDVWVAARAPAALLIPAERCLIWASALLRWSNLLRFRDVSVPEHRAKELISSLICSRKKYEVSVFKVEFKRKYERTNGELPHKNRTF